MWTTGHAKFWHGNAFKAKTGDIMPLIHLPSQLRRDDVDTPYKYLLVTCFLLWFAPIDGNIPRANVGQSEKPVALTFVTWLLNAELRCALSADYADDTLYGPSNQRPEVFCLSRLYNSHDRWSDLASGAGLFTRPTPLTCLRWHRDPTRLTAAADMPLAQTVKLCAVLTQMRIACVCAWAQSHAPGAFITWLTLPISWCQNTF